MPKYKNLKNSSSLFVPSFSVSLLYQINNKVALRVFISNAKLEQQAIDEAKLTYSILMKDYQLVQVVVAKINYQKPAS